MRINLKNIIFLAVVSALVSGFYSCSRDYGLREDDNMLYLTVRASTSINEDDELWEDRVDELRMIMFESTTGLVAYNETLFFPNGYAASSSPIAITPGEYDIYFIANESAVSSDFTAALRSVATTDDFTTDPRFTKVPYNFNFKPDGTTAPGRFLMSAVYENIILDSGGTINNPLPLPLPTAKVELVRSLAKVDVIFRKRTPGEALSENTITRVGLINVPTAISVPPYDDYYTGTTTGTNQVDISGFDYGNDSIGMVTFYVPEFLLPAAGINYTQLRINNSTYPIQNDQALGGVAEQRRTLPAISPNSVIRNYHYIINAYVNYQGGVELRVFIEPWERNPYILIFEGDQSILIPPVEPGDSSIIIPTECGKVEILSHNEQLSQGLQGAYNDVVNYYDPEVGGPVIYKGDPPYYCEKKYGPGWRLINSCELLSFLAYCDVAYNVWTSNTWLAANHNIPYHSLPFRQEAQVLLEKLTGVDLSSTILYPVNNHEDVLADQKVDIIDRYFTPGDIMLREQDFPGGWPFASPPGTNLEWFYNEVTIQVKAYWYGSGYISLADRSNWDTVLYNEFERYDFGSTVSRCVREID